MVDPEVEGIEVVPFGLQLGPLGHLPAHGDEHIAHVVDHLGDGMQRPTRQHIGGQSHVDALGDQGLGQLLLRQLPLSCRDRLAHLATRPAHPRAGLLARGGWQATDLAVRQGQWRTISRMIDTNLFQLCRRRGCGNSGQRVGDIALDGCGLKSRRLLWIGVVVRT